MSPAAPRVLVVDDESAMNDYIADVLKQAGFEVFLASDGMAALDAFKAHAPNVVILDIFMPKKDGLEVLIEIRHQGSNVPVLVISGKQLLLSDSSMGLARQLGANDVLGKPFTPEELVSRVSALVQTKVAQPKNRPGADQTTFLTFRRCIDIVRSHLGLSGRK